MTLSATAENALEVATCAAQQSVVEHARAQAQRLSLHLLDEAQIQQECQRLDNIISRAEANLIQAVRMGDIKRARNEVFTASQAHAKKAGYLSGR